jgi:adenine-specific DNA-methyltransferase
MANFFETLLEVLKADERFFAEDGTLLRNKVYESALNMDAGLIGLLLGNDETKRRFFTEVNDPSRVGGTFVFDKVGFGWVVNNRQFLPDSYTRFKNRIGLTDARGDLISTSGDVVLSFPYKDCVLEGGQSHDDQKRDEVFYNATLAPDEVDRLLYPKVLVGAKRYTASGVEEGVTFDESDNLVIKGNNLLAIASLLKRYEGKIKCIYIDPPYNTSGDANVFSYNNSFNHSTWLTFMKNRLEYAKRLLRSDGFIVVAIDHAELFYLGALADEIFGRENFISIITVQHNPKGRNQSKFFSANSEFLLVYARDKAQADFYSVAIDDEVKSTFTEQDKDGLYRWEPYIRARTVWSRETRPDNWYPIYISKDLTRISSEPIPDAYELYPRTNTGEFCWKNVRETFDLLNRDGYFRAISEGGKIVLQHKYREQQVLKNVWIDKKYQSEFNGTNLLKELIGKNTFSYPKSLYAVIDIVKIMSGRDDIVLDFFGGSGTTAHAVMETNKEQGLNRRFILCEQLDGHIDVIYRRLQAVFEKDGFLASSFVGCELAKGNQRFIEETEDANTDADLTALLKRVLATGFISNKVNPADIVEAAADFEALSIEDKKHFILELLDKNMLYVNLCDLDDEEYGISDADKAFTRSFYGMEGDRV